MAQIPEKVNTGGSITGGNPFRNLKSPDLRRDDTSTTAGFKSVVKETISGRRVYVPVKK